MPHRRIAESRGTVFHVVNRSVRRVPLFAQPEDYDAFLRVLKESLYTVPTRLLAYCIMNNHWHLVVWPIAGELPRFMHWLTMTHAKRWHVHRQSVGMGPVYQNRYHCVPIERDAALLAVLRYVERNPLRARLVERAEHWPWSSLAEQLRGGGGIPLSTWPIPRPGNWVEHVNHPVTAAELNAIRTAIKRDHSIDLVPCDE